MAKQALRRSATSGGFPPFGALRHHLPPAMRWDNKDPQSNPFISRTTISTGYSAPTCGGSPAKRARGNAFPRPPGRLYGFSRQRRYKKWRRKRRTSPVERYFIPPEGESPEPACKAKPITGRTLASQGQRPGGWLNPHARKGVSTFGNTGKHRPDPDPDPDPDRAERRLNPRAP